MKTALRLHEGRAEASKVLSGRLRALECWSAAGVIYGFSPLASEPDWKSGMADVGKVIAYPRISGADLLFFVADCFVRGVLGAHEPVEGELAPSAELILVPGLAFDRRGGRLGRGGGFYDRLLARRESAFVLGVCFACQIVEEVPGEEHDVKVDAVLTEADYFAALER